MPQTALACVAVGSNLGDRSAHLAFALDQLACLPRSRLLAGSSVVETQPVGGVPQGSFLNAAALIETALAPDELLRAMLEIERRRGRVREPALRWGPRTLDLDLLLYDSLVMRTPALTIPHPEMHRRAFVLEPLAEIAPDLVHPTLGSTVRELRDLLRTASAAGPP